MRIVKEAFAKQLFYEGNRTILSGVDRGFTPKATLGGKEQIGIGRC
jgi:hypothetical protein